MYLINGVLAWPGVSSRLLVLDSRVRRKAVGSVSHPLRLDEGRGADAQALRKKQLMARPASTSAILRSFLSHSSLPPCNPSLNDITPLIDRPRPPPILSLGKSRSRCRLNLTQLSSSAPEIYHCPRTTSKTHFISTKVSTCRTSCLLQTLRSYPVLRALKKLLGKRVPQGRSDRRARESFFLLADRRAQTFASVY